MARARSRKGAAISDPGKVVSRPLALTSGEPAGIGPDITLLAWLRRDDLSLPPFYVLGDREFFARRARALGLDIPFAEVDAVGAAAAFARALPIVATGHKAIPATPSFSPSLRPPTARRRSR